MRDRPAAKAHPTAPLCPTTPGGIPIRLLVDGEPRSRARRALPLMLLLALAAGLAAVALAGCGAPPAPRVPAAVVNRDPAWSDGLSPGAYVARMAADGMLRRRWKGWSR